MILPKSNFNHNHDKLFFFFGTRVVQADCRQRNLSLRGSDCAHAGGRLHPGDSDNAYTTKLLGYGNNRTPNNGTYATGATTTANNAFICTAMSGTTCIASMLNPAAVDPTGTGQALVNTYPLPTADPAANGGYNYISSGTRFANMIQYRGRIDYSISNSTKLYVQYNHQNDNAEESLDTLWTGNATSWVSPTTPYPTPTVEKSDSEVLTAGLTKVFSPTLTNEVVFNYVFLNLPNTLQDPAKAERGSLGINYTMLFSHPNQQNLIFPQLTGWGDGVSNQLQSGFELNGTIFAKKTLPSVADNISKVWRTHTAKFGFYWERTWNSQPGDAAVNGNGGIRQLGRGFQQ